MKHFGDITKISGYELPIVDVITGGSPCQGLSVAGLKKGLQDERSGLFLEQIRIIKEMREHDRQANGRPDEFVRPRYMVFENVPGLLSCNQGKDFQICLTEIIRIAEPNAPSVSMPAVRGGANGKNQDSSTMRWGSGALLGEYTMRSTGERPCMMTREMSYGMAHRSGASESLLSQILEESVPERYCLSAKACAGILKRSERRKKKLPEDLKATLERQAGAYSTQAEGTITSRSETCVKPCRPDMALGGGVILL